MKDSLTQALTPLRQSIDAIDEELIHLLNKRAALALEVGEIKGKCNAAVFDPQREKKVIERLEILNNGPLKKAHITPIWREIMSASRSLERPTTVAFLGPKGTYSEQAVFNYFGQSIHTFPCLTIDEIFKTIAENRVDFAVVPIENSTEGSVSRTLDLLLHTPLLITAECILPISHCLLTLDGKIDNIACVCAHPQALAQCQNWLTNNLPKAERRAISSNAEGAVLAAKDKTMAAIASAQAGALYGLETAFNCIQDDADNRTRFIVLGGKLPVSTGHDQTSLILSTKNEAGAILKLLKPFEEHRISMIRFQSRPARSGKWEYYFYIDIEGHRDDKALNLALNTLKSTADFYKELGSYPRSLL